MGELLQEEINTTVSAAEAASAENGPENGAPDPFDQAAADHEAYAASRRGLYCGRCV